MWLLHFKHSSHGQHATWTCEPNMLHLFTKTQPTATSTSLIIAKYVPEIYLPTKLDIYTIYGKSLNCMYRGCRIYIGFT